jgi:phosphate transport system protein
MVRQSLTALAGDRVDIARDLFRRDDEVDQMYRQTNQMVVAELAKGTGATARLACVLLVVRHFERIADNACKIAEKTIYAVTGQRRAEYLPRRPARPAFLEPT